MNRVKLILLCGVPGSGKTTYAEKYVKENPNTIHLSSDKIRAELWGNEATQGDNDKVFSLMQSRAIDALHDGKNVVYDATNVTRKDRSYIISLCPKFVQIEAHIIWAPIETCIERDAARERTVGKEVIDKMLKRFQPPYVDEGIDEIKIVLPDNFDSNEYTGNVMRNMNIPHDNPHHTLGVREHCMEAYMNACDLNGCTFGHIGALARAALWHDIGKPYTKGFVDAKGNPCEVAHYYQHQCVGAWMSYGIVNATPFIAWLIGVHMEPFFNSKYYKNLPSFLKRYVDKLHECDVNAH